MTMMLKQQNSVDKFIEFKDEINVLKSLVNASFIIETLGFKIAHEDRKEIRGACIIHGGDNKTSFRFNKDKGTWACFSHKCHEVYGSDIIGLVRSCLGLSFVDAINYIKDITGYSSVNKDKFYETKASYEKKQFIKKLSEDNGPVKPNNKFIDESVLNKYKEFGPSLLGKYLSREAIEFFEVGGGHVDKDGFTKDIIPIRGIDGDLVGVSYRDIREHKKIDDKYKTIVNKDKVLYNLNNALSFCDRLPLIVVEGFKDVWHLYECGIKNVVCVMGSTITSGQCALLYKYASKGVVLMFDNDIAGVSGMIQGYNVLIRRMSVYLVFITATKDGIGLDPADLPEKEVKKYLNGYF